MFPYNKEQCFYLNKFLTAVICHRSLYEGHGVTDARALRAPPGRAGVDVDVRGAEVKLQSEIFIRFLEAVLLPGARV